ncbi:hypothetical protein [Aureivirga sp. CE67]|uniref:hypothetical protein n=1 Tax=Aureivirga sp. CE67 TaxID=1788983 RepID=UPI0018C94901|nr:hypothetical protein [Aureivirga sp. CE67]
MYHKINQIEYLKDCKGIKGSIYENLGENVFNQIKNIVLNKDLYITHIYIPKGSEEIAQNLSEIHKIIFNKKINEGLFSFYKCFNGFEFRYVNARKMWEEEINLKAEFKVLSFDDLLKNDCKDLRKEFLEGLGVYENESPFEFRLSDSNYLYDSGFYDGIEEELEYSNRKLIPPYDFLFHSGNKIQSTNRGEQLFYFDFYSNFSQILYGEKNDKHVFWQSENFGTHITNSFRKEEEKKIIEIV